MARWTISSRTHSTIRRWRRRTRSPRWMPGTGCRGHDRGNIVLTVYGRKSSFNLQKVMWLVAELGVPHRHIELGGSFGGLDTPDFRAMNPHRRVPVIDDDGTVVWESHAILRYLAARYGADRFWSGDPAQ